MRIRFTETRAVKDEIGRVFKEGEVYDLPEDSAQHWLSRNAAVIEPDQSKPRGRPRKHKVIKDVINARDSAGHGAGDADGNENTPPG